MPPQPPPPLAPSTRTSGKRIVLILLCLLVLAGGAWWLLSRERSPDWGNERFLIQSATGSSYVFSNGTFAETERGPDPETRFEPSGWPPVVIEQGGEGLRACSEEACVPLLSFGAPLDRPAAFTVSGDLLLIVHPFVGDLQGYRLIPANPAHIEPAFIIENLGLASATGLVGREKGTGEYLFVRPTEAGFEICAATLAADRSSFSTQACAPYAAGAKIGDAVITKLP